MEITPRELRDVEIRDSIRGYHREDVNDLLERAAATIEAEVERIQQLTERLAAAQSEAGRTRETEDVLHRTLLLAQRAADEAVAEATAKSRQMLDDADIRARRLVADADAEARHQGESERRRLEQDVLELAGRRDALLADVEALTRFEAEYRERMVRGLEADLSALRSRPATAPGTRPEPTDGEVREIDGEVREIDGEVPEIDGEVVVAERIDPVVQAAPAPVATPVIAPEPPRSELDSTDGEPSANASMSTHEVDVRSLFENAAPPAAGATDTPEASQTRAPQPFEMLGNDGADADVLDDEAFFATLRDAVHDEAPLGPRDDNDVTGEQRFFDQDADRGGFRDVFRRRR